MIGSPILNQMIGNCIGDHIFVDRSQPWECGPKDKVTELRTSKSIAGELGNSKHFRCVMPRPNSWLIAKKLRTKLAQQDANGPL